MANENEKIVISDEDISHQDFSDEVLKDDSVDWKSKALETQGIAKRRATQLEKAKAEIERLTGLVPKQDDSQNKEIKTEIKKTDDFDYGQKAYLKASGINADEVAFVKEFMENTGKGLDETLESKYFQAELKEKRDAKAAQEAMPSANKRSSASARDTVDYWLAKGELPPADQIQLRRDVVNAKIKKEQEGSKFSSNSVIAPGM